MINFQLNYLKYTSSEHPEDLAALFDGKFKENLMETTVELLFQQDLQSKESQSVIRKSNLENLDLSAPSTNILNNNDMDLIPEVIGLYEDSDKVLEAIKGLKYKRPTPSSMREENTTYEKTSQYGKSREESDKTRKDETSTNASEEHRMETENKFKTGFRDEVNQVTIGAAYPDYSKNPPASYHSSPQFSHNDNRKSGSQMFENNSNEHGKRYLNLAYQATGSHNNGDQRNMGNYDYQQQHYHQNQMNYGGGKPGNFNAAGGPPFTYSSQMHQSPTYNTIPNYSIPLTNFSQGQPYYGGYSMYPNSQYQGNGTSVNSQEGSGYRSGNNNMQSGKNYKPDQGKKQDSTQKHSEKSAR